MNDTYLPTTYVSYLKKVRLFINFIILKLVYNTKTNIWKIRSAGS